jgi:hypothetical protein
MMQRQLINKIVVENSREGASIVGHIPIETEWYIADLLMEITVHGAKSNVIHRNLTLIRADSPEKAYQKAQQIGTQSETAYKNPQSQLVEIRFRGIAKLDAIYEPLEDGAELAFEEIIGVSEQEIQRIIPPREKLDVFVQPMPGRERDPDYRSQAVADQAFKMIVEKKRNE